MLLFEPRIVEAEAGFVLGANSGTAASSGRSDLEDSDS